MIDLDLTDADKEVLAVARRGQRSIRRARRTDSGAMRAAVHHKVCDEYVVNAKGKAEQAVRRLISECMDILGPDSRSGRYPVEQAFSRIMDTHKGPSETQKLRSAPACLASALEN